MLLLPSGDVGREDEMAESREAKPALYELIRVHYEQPRERGDGSAHPPRLRLQDWQVVETASVDSAEYVLLRKTVEPKDGLDSLTPRERDAVHHACTGASNKDIAREMDISDSTVRVMLLRACRKLGVADRSALIRDYGFRQSEENHLRRPCKRKINVLANREAVDGECVIDQGGSLEGDRNGCWPSPASPRRRTEMANANAQPNVAALEKIMETVRSSPEEAKKFSADPKAYLKNQGLPTEGLKITTTTAGSELSEDQLDAVSGGGWSACIGPVFLSVGYSWP
jgi:DNA-binding CsgD family transcriptional regulator